MVFDLKQARKAHFPIETFIDEFLPYIAHVHISDCTKDAPCVLPFSKGTTFDFPKFFKTMQEKGYKEEYMVELYDFCYDDPMDIKAAYDSLKKCL